MGSSASTNSALGLSIFAVVLTVSLAVIVFVRAGGRGETGPQGKQGPQGPKGPPDAGSNFENVTAVTYYENSGEVAFQVDRTLKKINFFGVFKATLDKLDGSNFLIGNISDPDIFVTDGTYTAVDVGGTVNTQGKFIIRVDGKIYAQSNTTVQIGSGPPNHFIVQFQGVECIIAS